MASPPGMPTQFVASAPASSGFRLDEICSSNCLRGKTGRFLTSPNHSPMVTMDGAITWNISGTIPDLRPVETTAFTPPFRRSIGHFGHLEPSGAHFGDNNISYPDMWTHPSWCHLSNGPPLYNAKRPPSTTFATAKITYHDTIYWPALRLLGIVLGTPPLMQSDSQSAINMSMDPIAFKNTKHILRAAEFLRDLVHREAVSMQHLPGRARGLHRPAAPHRRLCPGWHCMPCVIASLPQSG